MTRALSLSLACLPLLWLAASTAHGQRGELEGAIELSRRGEDAAALARYEQLLASGREPEALARAGLAHMALGRWLRADALLAEALSLDGAWVLENQQALEIARRRCQLRLARVVIDAPQGAVIRAGERELGEAPLGPTYLEPGEAVLVASLQGHEDARVSVRLEPGAEEQIALRPEPLDAGQALSCSEGRVDGGGACCWPEQRWLAAEGRCDGIPFCPRGYRREGVECVAGGDVAEAPRPFSGGEIRLLGAWDVFTDSSTGLFRAGASDALDAAFGGGDIGFEIGARPIWFLALGLRLSGGWMSTANWLDGERGANQDAPAPGTLMMGNASAYLRVHSAETMHEHQVDLWLGGGFGVGGVLLLLDADRADSRVWTFVVPIDGGLTYHPTRNFGLTVFGSFEPWILQEYCGEDPTLGDPYCLGPAELDLEFRIRVGGGFTMLF